MLARSGGKPAAAREQLVVVLDEVSGRAQGVVPTPVVGRRRRLQSVPRGDARNDCAAATAVPEHLGGAVVRGPQHGVERLAVGGDSCVCPFDSCSSRSSAMNSLTTEAMGIASVLPLETICPVLRSRTVVVMSAPASRGFGGGLPWPGRPGRRRWRQARRAGLPAAGPWCPSGRRPSAAGLRAPAACRTPWLRNRRQEGPQ